MNHEDYIFVKEPYVPICSKDEQFPQGMADPHYSDERFQNGALTLFLAEGYELTQPFREEMVVAEGVEYCYRDRLFRQDNSKSNHAEKAAIKALGSRGTPRYHEEYLKAYFDDPELELVHILAGVKIADDGFPFWVYGYKPSTQGIAVSPLSVE